jgi:methionyl-tRNA formyltransferase
MAPLLKKEDGRIDWAQPAQTIFNRMRGFTPWPGAYTAFRSATCQLAGEPVSNQHGLKLAAGQMHLEHAKLVVGCGGETLLGVSRVKVEGRKEVSALEFANGARLQPGDQFAWQPSD